MVSRFLISLGRILLLFALLGFLLLPPRDLFLLSLATLFFLAAPVVTRCPIPSGWRPQFLLIVLAEHVLKFLFAPVALLKIGLVWGAAGLVLCAAGRANRRAFSTLLAASALAIFAAGGTWAYEMVFPPLQRVGNPSGPVVFLGDSLTAGLGEEDARFLYVAQMQKEFAIPLINSGRAGDLSADALARLDSDVLARNPRLVVVLIGGNDILMGAPRRTLATNLTEIVRRVTSAQIDVVLVEVPGGAIVDRYLGVYAAAAKRFHTSLIGESLLRRLFAFSQLYTIDGTHLNARGHAAVAKRLSRVLRKTYGVR